MRHVTSDATFERAEVSVWSRGVAPALVAGERGKKM